MESGKDQSLTSPDRPKLAQEFCRELRAFLVYAARRPDQYHFFKGELRRVNLKRFPYRLGLNLRPRKIRNRERERGRGARGGGFYGSLLTPVLEPR